MILLIAKYFAKNTNVTNMFLLFILIMGVFVGLHLKRDITPYVEPEALYIRIVYPGASAQEIEQNVVIPFEKVIQTFELTPRYSCFINDNFALLVLTFIGARDIKDTKQRAIRLLQNSRGMDPNAKIYITEEGPNSLPIYYAALYRDTNENISLLNFHREAAKIEQQLERIPGISGLDIGGLQEEEIQIVAEPNLLDKFYISLYEIIQAIQNRNLKISGGSLEFGSKSKNLITDGGFENPMDVKDLIIRSSFENQKIRVEDVASVQESLAKTSLDVEINGGEGVFFGLKMKPGEDINKTTLAIDSYIVKLQKTLPKGMKLQIIEKRYTSVNNILSLTQGSALLGIIIVFGILLLFFDKRTSFWTTATIPFTIALTLIYMYFADISINILSLCAIITVLGMLVDHGIVISENIYFYRLAGSSPTEAMTKGIKEVFLPILVTVLTTVAAFLPLLSIKGLLGAIIKPIPLIISAALLFSFIDAMILLPAHLYHVPKKNIPSEDKPWLQGIQKAYSLFLTKALKKRYIVTLLFLIILGCTGLLMQYMFKSFILMEPIGIGSIYVNLQSEPGTSFQTMKGLVQEMKTVVQNAVPESDISAIRTETGRHQISELFATGNKPNRGQVAVFLNPNGRNFEPILKDIETAIEKSDVKNKFIKIIYETYGLIPKSRDAIVLEFAPKVDSSSKDYIPAMLETFEYVKGIKGIINPEHSTIQGENELIIVFDYEKAARLGVEVRAVAETLRIAAGGLVVSKWRSDLKEISYLLKLNMDGTDNIKTIGEMQIPNRYMRLISLKEFARIEERPGEGDIVRMLGNRVVNINAEVDPKIVSPTLVAQEIIDYFNTEVAPKYPETQIISSGESQDMETYFAEFKVAFLVALVFIYLILLMLFQSAVQPLIVLITIPFGIVGAVWAFYLHGQALSFMSLVGVIGLSGVVVNDAIVMVNFINNLVRSESDKNISALIVEGAEKRFKAVLLTTLTTVAGLLPSIYGLKGVADLIIPIATAMAYGLLFATLLTLIFIPCIYLIGMDIGNLFIRFKNKRWSS